MTHKSRSERPWASKHAQLVDEWNATRRRIRSHTTEIEQFIIRLLQGLREYLEIPKGRMHYAPLDEKEAKPGVRYTLVGALRRYPQDPVWWTARTMITMEKSAGSAMSDPIEPFIGFGFMVRKSNGTYTVKLGPDATTFEIDPEVQKSKEVFFDYCYGELVAMIRRMRLQYTTGELREQSSHSGRRTIGFVTPPSSSAEEDGETLGDKHDS